MSVKNENPRINLTNKKIKLSLFLSFIAFGLFFIAALYIIKFSLTLDSYISSNYENIFIKNHIFLYILPPLGGYFILIINKKKKYAKPFNDFILFSATALSAYSIFAVDVKLNETKNNLLYLLFGERYALGTTMFICTCLIAKALIACHEFVILKINHIIDELRNTHPNKKGYEITDDATNYTNINYRLSLHIHLKPSKNKFPIQSLEKPESLHQKHSTTTHGNP